MRWTLRPASVIAAMAFASGAAHADGDAALGKAVFNKCAACHDGRNQVNKVGPTLVGVVGRPAATVEGFKYSQAMIEAGAAGLVWDVASLAEYLKAPRQKVPGNKMAFPGLKKDEDIANVIAWLSANPKP